MSSILEATLVRGAAVTAPLPVGDHLRVLKERDVAPPHFISWRILTAADGDRRIVWDPESFTEIREAKELFDAAVASGLVPYVVDAAGLPTGDVMDVFDPSAADVVFRDVVFAPAKLAVGG